MKAVHLILLIFLILNCTSNESEIELLQAVKNNDLKEVTKLLSDDLNIDYKDNNGNTALIYAIKSKHSEVVKLLIDSGANVNTKNKQNETPLSIASKIDTNLMILLNNHIHKKDFNQAVKLKDYALFISEYPNSMLVDSAIDSIKYLLLKEYPLEKYNNSIPKTEFKLKYLEALKTNTPYLVAFAPKEIKGSGYWSWTTYFKEIAGAGVELHGMQPSIFVQGKGSWSFRDTNGLRKSIKIRKFGSGSHNWWCQSSDFKGGSANLRYSGTSFNNAKSVSVSSFTRFQK